MKQFFTFAIMIFCAMSANAQGYTWAQPMGPQVLNMKPVEMDYQFWLVSQNDSSISNTGRALTALNDRTKAAIDGLSFDLARAEASAAALAGLDVPALDKGETWAGASAGASQGRGALAVGIAHSFSHGSTLKFSAATNKSFSFSIGKKW